jgi:hypothetical protein
VDLAEARAVPRTLEPGRPRTARCWASVGLGLLCLAVGGFYLLTYGLHGFRVPIGWDAAGYAWRTAVARSAGLRGLQAPIPAPGPVNPGRPGFVVLAALAGAVGRLDPLVVASILPALVAVCLALSVWALLTAGLRRPRWQGLLAGVLVGTSTFVVHLANVEGYQDGLLAVILGVGALVLAVSPSGRKGLLGSAALFTGAALAHWDLFLFTGLVAGAAGVVLLPEVLRRERALPRVDTMAARLLLPPAVGAAVGFLLIRVLLGARLPTPRLDEAQFFAKASRDIPSFFLPLWLPAAAIGALLLARIAGELRPERDSARGLLAVSLSWGEITVAAFALAWLGGELIPTHRVLAATMAVPILGSLAVVTGVDRLRRLARPAAIGVAGLALLASAGTAQATWLSFRPVMDPTLLRQARTAVSLLHAAGVPEDQSVVVVVDSSTREAWSDLWLDAHTIRAAFGARVPQLSFAVGDPSDALAGRPTTRPLPGDVGNLYEGISLTYFGGVRAVEGRSPVTIVLAAANPRFPAWVRDHPADLRGPGVALARGPSGAVPATPPTPPTGLPSLPALLGIWVLALLGLGVAGGGWSRALVRRRLGTGAAGGLAPTFGLATLLVGGVVLNRLGLPLRSWGGVAIVLLVGGGGWLLDATMRAPAEPTSYEPAVG